MSDLRAGKLVVQAHFDFEGVRDPRRAQCRRHSLRGILNATVAGLATGSRSSRDVEGFSARLCPERLQRLGLQRPVSDTTCYETWNRIDPNELRPVVTHQVTAAWERAAIGHDLFPWGVVTIDGKATGGGKGQPPDSHLRTTRSTAEGSPYYFQYALRCVLTSSSARPVLTQQSIGSKESEVGMLPNVLDWVCSAFGDWFEFITLDAGFSAKHTAATIVAAGRLYLIGLKANQPTLYREAQRLLEHAPVEAQSQEHVRGASVHRQLRCVTLEQDFGFLGATQVWMVRQEWVDAHGQRGEDTRYFITNTPPNKLKPKYMLRLVRLHWGIENGANWTADMVFEEDTRCPCRTGQGLEVLSWLRVLAYNMVAIFRAQLPAKDRHPPTWKSVVDLLRQAVEFCLCHHCELRLELN